VSAAALRELPMFPLQSVLFPGSALPLHVFEPRYRALVRHCLAHDRTFGVVLIARGSEVGGGDERLSVGTLARIEEASELPDGRFVLIASAATRVAVDTWLPDDPYPRAVVGPRTTEGALDPATLDGALRAVRRAVALATELGASVPTVADPEPGADPEELLWRLCDAAPLGTLDRQRLLEADDLGQRAGALGRLATDAGDDLLALLSERRAP
jgi:uncharacterized protein